MITLLNKFDDNYIINPRDVFKIVSYYIKKEKLEKYICDVTFNYNWEYMGSYTAKGGRIDLNDDTIMQFCRNTFNKLSKIYHIDSKYYSYFYNYCYLYVLFHEITHAIQVKKYYANESNLYNYLFELCHKLHGDSKTFYCQNHNLFPMEIEANNNAYLQAYNFISHTKLPIREKSILYIQYLFSLLYNYEKIDKYHLLTPIDKLYWQNNNINIDLIFKLLDNEDLSKIERLNLGVCVTLKEYDSIENEKRKILHRKIEKNSL